MKINKVHAIKVLNSRADWTIKTFLYFNDGSIATATVPEGASKGEKEAVCLDAHEAVLNINEKIDSFLSNQEFTDIYSLDKKLIDLDSSFGKANLGANSILSISIAATKAFAKEQKKEVYQYISEIVNFKNNYQFPTPLFNILNGGKHASNDLTFQEFMVIPSNKIDFYKRIELGVNTYKNLKSKILTQGHFMGVGDEGGFAPEGFTAELALEDLRASIPEGFKMGVDVFLGMDVAAGSFYEKGKYFIHEKQKHYTSEELLNYYSELAKNFELLYIEDPFYENALHEWQGLFSKLGKKLLICGDDLLATNTSLLEEAIKKQLCNCVIVKPNQIGSVSETLDFIQLAKKNKMHITVSHRSGDTDDDFIADLALGSGADFIKTGAPARGERVSKYNRLLEIYYSMMYAA